MYGPSVSTLADRPLRLAAVLCVSTAGQIDGYGPDVHERDVRRWARTNERRIVKVFLGDVTGKAGIEERPGLTAALQMLADGEIGGIVTPNLDRLARELTQQEAILSVIWAHRGRAFTADRGEHLADGDDDPMRTLSVR